MVCTSGSLGERFDLWVIYKVPVLLLLLLFKSDSVLQTFFLSKV